MCNYLLHNFFLVNVKTWVGRRTLNGRKRGIALAWTKKITPRPQTAEDLRQTSNWSKLVAAYLPVARLTILNRLVNRFPTSLLAVETTITYKPRRALTDSPESSSCPIWSDGLVHS